MPEDIGMLPPGDLDIGGLDVEFSVLAPEDGVISNRYQLTKDFLKNKQPVKGSAVFPVNVFKWFLERLPYKKRCRQGEFIIEKLDVDFRDGKIYCEFEGYKV